MEINKLTKDKYDEWDDFCLKSDSAWFWHTIAWREYILNFLPEREAKDFSFFLGEKGDIKAIVPLICEINEFEGEKFLEFSYQNAAVPAPALANNLSLEQRKLIEEAVFKEIDRLARENKIARARFWISPLSPGFLKKYAANNFLLNCRFEDISLNTLLIDLRKSEANLKKELRRNHRRNILKGKEFKVSVYAKENIKDEIFCEYKKMHHKAAGRKTRTDKTFELMLKWIKEGWAFLAVVEFNGKKIGFEYYSVYKNNVYGFSAANDPDFGHLPIRHTLEWEAILWMKKQGFSFYEIGLQQYKPLPYDFPSKKQLNISHFKKGFGGFAVPLFIGEKYYEKNYQLKIRQWRKEKLANYKISN